MQTIGLIELIYRRWAIPKDTYGKTMIGLAYQWVTSNMGSYHQQIRLRTFLRKLYESNSITQYPT